jgi:hypothetical protein
MWGLVPVCRRFPVQIMCVDAGTVSRKGYRYGW